MKRKNTTRKALFTSVLSLLLCVSMLVGTTFAWFTDSVESGINQILAGNLDVELYHTNTKDNGEKVTVATKLFDEVDPELWEPGAMAYENLTVKNEGSLALKYQLAINFANATEVNGHTLVEALKVGVVEGGFKGTTREAVLAEVTNWQTLASFVLPGNLQAGKSEVYGIVIYWEPSANDNWFNMNNGNQGKVLSIDLGVKLEATQLTSEYDSFGNDYDAMAGGYYNVVYGFNNPADLLAFAPVAGDAASSGLSITPEGKAQIDNPGAWYTVDADLSKHEYVIEYDIDISNLSVGENVTVDTGNAANWASTPIMLERGSTKVYYGLAKNEFLGTLEGTVITVTHTYAYNGDGKLEITTTVSDGVKSISCTKAVASAAQTELYWDIYFATESGKATMDNFSVKSADAVVDSSAELAAALAEGGKVVLTTDIASADGYVISEDIVIDLNGNTLSASGDRAYLFNVTGDADLTIVGGELVAESTNGMLNGTGTSTGASSSVYFASTGTLTMKDVEIQGSVRGGHRAIDIYGGNAVLTNVDIVSSYGAGVVCGGKGVSVALNDCDITVNGMYSAPYNSVCFGVWGGAEMTVNSGNYKMINDNTYSTGDTHGGWVGIVMNSGGTLTINGGNYTNVPAAGFNPQYERAIIEAENLDPATATVNLLGGNFKPQNNKVVSGYGDVNYPVVNAYLIDNGDGTWTALPKIEGVTLTAVAGYSHLYTDGTNYYVYDAQGLISLNNFWQANCYGNNMWGCSYNVMADIDATGYTWNEAYVVVGNNDNNGFVFDGHGHTITGLTIKGSLFSGTPNGGNKPNNPGYMKNITFDGAKVVGDHFTGVLWSNVYNELVVENVTVINSEITGKCNVAALIGGTSVESGDASVKFINCVVKNNVITAEGKAGQDPNGAYAFLSRAFANTSVIFEGENVAEGNTIVNENGLVGGGIYGYTTWENGGFAGTGTCNSFTNWKEVEKVTVSTAEELKAAFNPTISDTTAVINITADIQLKAGETWTPLAIDPYVSGTVNKVIVNGNGHTISGLNAPLIGDVHFGGTVVEINDLTLADCEIISAAYNDGLGAFIAYADSCDSITLKNCHLIDSKIEATTDFTGVGGLVGYSSSPLTIENCSVVNTTVFGANQSAGAIAGHVYDANITNAKVMGCTIKGERVDKSGYVVGTINKGGAVVTTHAECANNTVFDVANSNTIYGRFVPNGSGTLTLNGVVIE